MLGARSSDKSPKMAAQNIPCRTWRELYNTLPSVYVSFQEIGSNIPSGGELYLIDNDTRVDTLKFLRFINEKQINRLFLPFVALQYLCVTSTIMGISPQSLKEVFSAGEQLQVTSCVRKFFKQLTDAKLHNHYGPSESHVITAYSMSGNLTYGHLCLP